VNTNKAIEKSITDFFSIVFSPEKLWGYYAENPVGCQDSGFATILSAKQKFSVTSVCSVAKIYSSVAE
jgi:hypothetical protein